MHAPVLVDPPETSPVRLPQVKRHLRVDGDDEDTLIQGLIDAAVAHLDGWSGILGLALVAQTWRQDFDRFARCLRLPLGPAIEIVTITVRDSSGQQTTIDDANYSLEADERGPYVRFMDDYSAPADLFETKAFSVSYVAGYADDEEAEESTVPAAIRQAMLLLVAHWYQNREAVVLDAAVELPLAVRSLLAPWRRVGF